MILTTVLCGVAAAAIQSLKSKPENTPPRWYQSDDPCGYPWVGVAATIQGSLHCQY